MAKPNFNDFNQDYRYTKAVETRLILSLPVTDFRPEAMRVTERKTISGKWFEVETFNAQRNMWIEQKSHPTEAEAIADANGWYPQPDCATQKEPEMANDEQQKLRCPTIPRHEGDLVGCGSTNVTEADEEGMHDCRDCGLFFTEEAAEQSAGIQPQGMNSNKELVLQQYPLANIIEGDGTNPPDIAVLTKQDQDSGLLSKLCFSEEEAWNDAAQRIMTASSPANEAAASPKM